MSLIDILKSLPGETVEEVHYGTYNSEYECVQEGIILKLSSGRCVMFVENTWLEFNEKYCRNESAAGINVKEYAVINLNGYKTP